MPDKTPRRRPSSRKRRAVRERQHQDGVSYMEALRRRAADRGLTYPSPVAHRRSDIAMALSAILGRTVEGHTATAAAIADPVLSLMGDTADPRLERWIGEAVRLLRRPMCLERSRALVAHCNSAVPGNAAAGAAVALVKALMVDAAGGGARVLPDGSVTYAPNPGAAFGPVEAEAVAVLDDRDAWKVTEFPVAAGSVRSLILRARHVTSPHLVLISEIRMNVEECADDLGGFSYIGGSQVWWVVDESTPALLPHYEFGDGEVDLLTPWEELQDVSSPAEAIDVIERHLAGDPLSLMFNEADGPLVSPDFSVLWMPLEEDAPGPARG